MILRVKKEGKELYKELLNIFSLLGEYNLTASDIAVAAEILDRNFNLISKVQDESIRNEILFSAKEKKALHTNLNISYNTFNNALTKLRKANIIKDNKLNTALAKIDINSKLNLNIVFNDKV